jgi:thymidylate synthase (FAD)
MKLIKPSFTIIEQGPGIEGVYKQIELAGRTCYKSEDKITATSAKEFVDRMIKSGHGAMLEHGTVYLKAADVYGNDYNGTGAYYVENPLSRYRHESHSRHKVVGNTTYVTTNLRVLVENDWMSDLEYGCDPTENHDRRYTVKFTCDRGVTHEFVRHRVFSFAQESTRYCNYSKDKFGNNVTYIIPCWTKTKECEIDTSQPYGFTAEDEWICMLGKAEKHYFRLINMGWKAQEARAVLPNALKAELVMTGFVDDWKHFFHLRTATGAHPQARELALPLQNEFRERRYI